MLHAQIDECECGCNGPGLRDMIFLAEIFCTARIFHQQQPVH
jgi:hypothetical protein